MDMLIMILLVMIPLALAYFWYVAIITRKNKAFEAKSGIDVQLKKRHDLIPNILKLAQRFMDHEKELLTEITELRAKAMGKMDSDNPEDIKDLLNLEATLQGKMGQLMVAVENYPDLKSDETMLQAQRTYNEVEEQIAAARRFYNSAVTALNNSIQIFPGNIIGNMAGVSEMPFFETDEASREPVNVDDYMK